VHYSGLTLKLENKVLSNLDLSKVNKITYEELPREEGQIYPNRFIEIQSGNNTMRDGIGVGAGFLIGQCEYGFVIIEHTRFWENKTLDIVKLK